MNSCELVAAVSAIALGIADMTTQEELELLSAVFVQLGDTLATIAASKSNQSGV